MLDTMAIIDVQNLRKRYGEKVAVDDVSFSVEQGEIFSILGPNGAGKTTTVESLSGMRVPDAGTIRVAGLDPRTDRTELRRKMGVQLQESRVPERLKVGEVLDLFASFYPTSADTGALLENLGLAHQRETQYRKLSGGQKQRLSIALALVGRPRIAVLDELTTGLDPQARRDTWSLVEGIRDSGVTIVLVTHFMDEAERLSDRLAVIDGGRIVALDSPAGLIGQASPDQQVRFRVPTELDDRLLDNLAEVRSVHRTGTQVVVTGQGNLLQTVTSALAREGVVAEELRMEQSSLDDAFVTLTGRKLDS